MKGAGQTRWQSSKGRGGGAGASAEVVLSTEASLRESAGPRLVHRGKGDREKKSLRQDPGKKKHDRGERITGRKPWAMVKLKRRAGLSQTALSGEGDKKGPEVKGEKIVAGGGGEDFSEGNFTGVQAGESRSRQTRKKKRRQLIDGRANQRQADSKERAVAG